MIFSKEIIDTYPFPIAVAAKRFNDATEHVERFLSLANLIETTLKYLAAIAIVEYLRDEEVVESLQKRLRNLRRPTLGRWNELLRAILKHYREAQTRDFTMAELLANYAEKIDTTDANAEAILSGFHFVAKFLEASNESNWERISLQNFLDMMVRYRNKSWGHGIAKLTVFECQEHVPVMQPAVEALLLHCDYLAHYPLQYVHAVQMDKGTHVHTLFRYMGDSWQKQAPYKGPYAQERRLHLCSQEGVPRLSLHPLFIIRRREMYILEYNDQNEDVAYTNCATGEDWAPDNLQSYAITQLADDRHKKLGDLELPVPPEDPPEFSVDAPPSLREVLERLDDDARRALAIGLGESLRLGLFWVGLEFLLMGLSKQGSPAMAALLNFLHTDGLNLRGWLRGLVTDKNKNWRKLANVAELGAAEWERLEAADGASLGQRYGTDDAPAAVVTPRLLTVLREAARLAGEAPVTPAHLLLAMLAREHGMTPAINFLYGLAYEAKHDPREMPGLVMGYLKAAAEDGAQPDAGAQAAPAAAQPAAGEQPATPGQPITPPAAYGAGVDAALLDKIGRNLTALAAAGDLQRAEGAYAHQTMVQMGLILQQTQANNPILLGDPGVGKTAIVEGFAWRLALGAQYGQPVDAAIAKWQIIEISAAALKSGTELRGSLEGKLTQLLAEVRQAKRQIIIFIDEIHTILGGRGEGSLGVIADVLKPALARGEFPCIGATTVAEYRRHIESDPALSSRFTPVWVEEPTPEETVAIAKKVAANVLQPHHRVTYDEQVIREAVRLAVRYLHDEFLPRKVIKLLDQAGPRVRMGSSLRGQELVGVPLPPVTMEMVQEIVSTRTGIPLMRLHESENQKVLQLEERLRVQVLGQERAIAQVANVVKRAKAGFADDERPLGVFLFAGPTGVGKTELAQVLTDALFDDRRSFLRLDMSEFMEKHQVSRLIGAPPGYVGYEDEGQLTGFLRRRPYSVVLFDEIEKAHPELQNLLLQLFDAGRLTDSRGRPADGRNAIFIMTTNLGAKAAMGLEEQAKPYREKLKTAVENHFSPEFRGRIDEIIYFEPLRKDVLVKIFDKLFAEVARRFAAQGIKVSVAEPYKVAFCERHSDTKRGARDLQRAIEAEIVTYLSELKLKNELQMGMSVQVTGDRAIDGLSQAGDAPAEAVPLAEAQPKMDPEEARNRQMIQPLVEKLTHDLHAQGVTLLFQESAWEVLCSPYMAEAWVREDVAAAFAQLVDAPARQLLAAGELAAGDRLEVYRNVESEIALRKLTGDVE